jgi:hypothetical protein
MRTFLYLHMLTAGSAATTSLRKSGNVGGAKTPHDCALQEESMPLKPPRGLRPRARQEVSTENHRVTARIVRDDDGSARTIYRVDGHGVGSRAALEAVMEGHK